MKSDDPLGFLRGSPFVNLGLADHAGFRDLFLGYRGSIAEVGASKTLDKLLSETR